MIKPSKKLEAARAQLRRMNSRKGQCIDFLDMAMQSQDLVMPGLNFDLDHEYHMGWVKNVKDIWNTYCREAMVPLPISDSVFRLIESISDLFRDIDFHDRRLTTAEYAHSEYACHPDPDYFFFSVEDLARYIIGQLDEDNEDAVWEMSRYMADQHQTGVNVWPDKLSVQFLPPTSAHLALIMRDIKTEIFFPVLKIDVHEILNTIEDHS